MGSDIVELIKDIVKYLSSGLVEYFLECRVSDKRQEYFSNKGGKWAKFCFYMSLIVSILLIIIGIVGLVKKKSISIFFLIAFKAVSLRIDCFFLPKFQIGVMKWCLLELFNKIIGT